MESDLLSLHWMEHASVFTQAIGRLRTKTSYADATLACEGHFFSVHKFVLSTCSQYFNAIFEWTPCINPVVVINNVTCKVLEILLDFMYTGEVSVKESLIPDVMRAAECLRIRGLVNVDQDNTKPQLKSKNKSDIDGPPRKRKRTASSKKKSTPAGSDKTPTSCEVSGSNGHLSHPHTSVTSHQCRNEGEMYDTDLVPDLASTHHTQKTPIKAENQDVDLPNTPSPNNTPSNSLQAPMSSPQSPHADEPVQPMPPPRSPTINQHSHFSLPHYSTPPYHQCALDLTAREHTSEVSMNTAVEVLKSGKVKSGQTKSFVPEAHNEVAAEEIPGLIDSLVDVQPLCDPKPEPEDEVATLHAVEPNDNMYGVAEVVPSASTASSQEEVQHQEGTTVPGSSRTKNENFTEVKPGFCCPQCNKEFTKKEGLSRHVRRHADKKPYTCNHCPFTCQKYRDLLDHKREEHASPFNCSKCNFTTDRQHRLTSHVKQHEKPYHCTECTYKASRPNMLKKHLESKHGKQ